MWKDSLSKTPMLKDLYPLVGPAHVISKNSIGWKWKMRVPPMVKFFWWKFRWGRLPCKSLLLARNLIDQNNACYDLCPTSLEDMTHILITYFLLTPIGDKSRNITRVSACLNQPQDCLIFYLKAIAIPWQSSSLLFLVIIGHQKWECLTMKRLPNSLFAGFINIYLFSKITIHAHKVCILTSIVVHLSCLNWLSFYKILLHGHHPLWFHQN